MVCFRGFTDDVLTHVHVNDMLNGNSNVRRPFSDIFPPGGERHGAHMEIRKRAELKLLYDRPQQGIVDSPEWMFGQALCDGRSDDVAALFDETKQFGKDASAADMPFGRFEGKSGIRAMAGRWLSEYRAVSATAEAFFQTRSGGRSVTEVVVSFVVDGMIDEVPMFVVGDLRAHRLLDEVRVYHHCTFLPQYQPYRKPMFRSAHLEMGDPGLLTGAVREYYAALHHVPSVDVERVVRCTSDDCKFGGYGPAGSVPAPHDHATIRKNYSHMATYIPKWVGMRYETLIDDGVTGVIEWVHIVTDAGVSEGGRVCLSGIAAYMRNEDGLICSIRISDYAGYEKTIDWSKASTPREEAFAINRIHEFPAGCGLKEQD